MPLAADSSSALRVRALRSTCVERPRGIRADEGVLDLRTGMYVCYCLVFDGGAHMKLPPTVHTSRPWRIHELTPDFRVEDVWALQTPGSRDDFRRLVEGLASGDPAQGSSLAVRALWGIRWRLGAVLGWDQPDAGLGERVPSLRERLPADLRRSPGPSFTALPFSPLYLTDDEFAAEIANRTVHGVMHLGWVPDGTGTYQGRMTVLVKPNGLLGRAYLTAIRPFRHLIVYPPAVRRIERQWRIRQRDDAGGAAAAATDPSLL
jgi:hypothetical protein